MKKLFLMSFVLVFVLSACNLLLPATPTVDPVAVAIAQTMAVQNAAQTLVAQSQPTIAPTLAAPPTQEVPPTVEPTIVPPTITPVPQIIATATKNVNCRVGPSTVFHNTKTLALGDSGVVIGKNMDNGTWWKISLLDGKECWVTSDGVNVTGDVTKVALLISPPTPTPVPPPSWAGLWNMGISLNSFDPNFQFVPFTTTMSQSGNALNFIFTAAATNFSVSGTVTPNGLQFDGILTRAGSLEIWAVRMVRSLDNLDQIKGRWNVVGNPTSDGNFCGYKNGAGFPSPCRP